MSIKYHVFGQHHGKDGFALPSPIDACDRRQKVRFTFGTSEIRSTGGNREMQQLTLMIALAAASLPSLPAAASETVMGRWCDHPIPTMNLMDNVTTVIVSDDGQMLFVQEYSAAVLETPLTQLAENEFQIAGGRDRLRIDAVGHLEFFDDDGLIRIAEPLPETSDPSRCYRD